MRFAAWFAVLGFLQACGGNVWTSVGDGDARFDSTINDGGFDASLDARSDSRADVQVADSNPAFDTNGADVSSSDTATVDTWTPPVDAGPRMPTVMVVPNDPGLHYEGRWQTPTASSAVTDFTGGSIRFQVEADSIFATFTDTRMSRPGKFAVYVDGARSNTLTLEEGTHEISIAASLGAGVHEIALEKASEPLRGRISFGGLRMLNATRPTQPNVRAYRIEFVGDSITCGGGNIAPDPCPGGNEGDATWFEDSAQAYPRFAAESLHAELSVVAESGIGVTAGHGGGRLSALYTRTVGYPNGWSDYNDNAGISPWSSPAQEPQAIVVNIGTNDLSSISEYEAALRTFTNMIRTRNPNAHIFLMVGGIIGGEPNQTQSPGSAGWLLALYDRIILEKANTGDARWHRIYHGMQPSGEMRCGHPTVAFHRLMADSVSAAIRSTLRWP